MSDSVVRLIRKYPNRRLYDTGRSAYIALEDVRALILAREHFRVIDARSGKDLTHAVLLQVFLDGETQEGQGVLTSGTLRALIAAQSSPQAPARAEALRTLLRLDVAATGAPDQSGPEGRAADRAAQYDLAVPATRA